MRNKILAILFVGFVMQGNAQSEEQQQINKLLDAWHLAAANADFEGYFEKMTKDGVFLGTDATENWQNKAFREFSKPYFDKGKAWSFTAVERNIYINENEDFAWFDELLDTQMKICRGSGVLKKKMSNGKLLIMYFQLQFPTKMLRNLSKLKRKRTAYYFFN